MINAAVKCLWWAFLACMISVEDHGKNTEMLPSVSSAEPRQLLTVSTRAGRSAACGFVFISVPTDVGTTPSPSSPQC